MAVRLRSAIYFIGCLIALLNTSSTEYLPINNKSLMKAVVQEGDGLNVITQVIRMMYCGYPVTGYKVSALLDVIYSSHPSYHSVALDVWSYLNNSGTKPNQLLYSISVLTLRLLRQIFMNVLSQGCRSE